VARRLTLISLLLALGALSGCGETPEGQAEQTVKDWISAFNERDPRLCTEVYSPVFLKRSVGSDSTGSEKRCVRSLKEFGPPSALKVTFKFFESTKVDGDKVTSVVAVEANETPQEITFTLSESDGAYRIDAITGGIVSPKGA